MGDPRMASCRDLPSRSYYCLCDLQLQSTCAMEVRHYAKYACLRSVLNRTDGYIGARDGVCLPVDVAVA